MTAKQTIDIIQNMALQELQPRIRVLGLEAIRRPVRPLNQGDVIERPMEGLVDPFTWGTYPKISIEIGEADVVNVTWHEASGLYNKEYTLVGTEIKGDAVVHKLLKYSDR